MKTIIKGVNKETGCFETEHKSTAVLITELIDGFPKMCEADVTHALEEIRASAEQDSRIRKLYVEGLKRRKSEADKLEREAINDAIDAIRRSVKETRDMKTAIVLIKLCKMIAGDRFEVKVEQDGEEK